MNRRARAFAQRDQIAGKRNLLTERLVLYCIMMKQHVRESLPAAAARTLHCGPRRICDAMRAWLPASPASLFMAILLMLRQQVFHGMVHRAMPVRHGVSPACPTRPFVRFLRRRTGARRAIPHASGTGGSCVCTRLQLPPLTATAAVRSASVLAVLSATSGAAPAVRSASVRLAAAAAVCCNVCGLFVVLSRSVWVC